VAAGTRDHDPGGGLAWAGGDWRMSPLAGWATRSGLTMRSAAAATRRFAIDATVNTACQLPVDFCSQLAAGTRNDAAPFAVYNSPAFVAAYFDPYVSVQMAGNRL